MLELHEFPIVHPRPLRVWTQEIPSAEVINQKIIKTINKHRQQYPEGYTDNININVWQTGWNMQAESGFAEVADLAKSMTKEIAEQQLHFANFTPKIVDCWSNVYNTDAGCKVHSHFPATFSLVYYVRVPEGSGQIFFPDAEVKLEPVPGLMICFEGSAWHGVEFNPTEEDRIIVAINIVYEHTDSD